MLGCQVKPNDRLLISYDTELSDPLSLVHFIFLHRTPFFFFFFLVFYCISVSVGNDKMVVQMLIEHISRQKFEKKKKNLKK
jgi:hypothetical protein